MSAFVLPFTNCSLSPSSSSFVSATTRPSTIHTFATPSTSINRRATIKAVLAEPPRPSTSSKSSKSTKTVTTMEQFWEIADDSKLASFYDADSKIAFLREASLDEVRTICLQYRYFVEKYPDNLSLVLAKMPKGDLKSFLGEILAEELGSGDINQAHSSWYDNFLRSLGVTDEEIENSLLPENNEILKEIDRRCHEETYVHCIGLVGMGRECLCQIYLTEMYRNLRANKNIKAIEDQIDWYFWVFHTGEEDVEHRLEMRKKINDMVMDEEGVQQLADGYIYAKSSWDMYWDNNYKGTRFHNQ